MNQFPANIPRSFGCTKYCEESVLVLYVMCIYRYPLTYKVLGFSCYCQIYGIYFVTEGLSRKCF
jgi:hypothetical protein